MKKGILGLVLCVMVAPLLFGQDYNVDRKKAGKVVSEANSLVVDFSIKILTGGDAPATSEFARVIKFNSSLSQQLGDLTTLFCEDGTLMIDYAIEGMALGMPDNQKKESLDHLMNQQLDTLADKEGVSVTFRGVENSLKHYDLINTGGMIPLSEVYYDESKGYLRRLVYRYDPEVIGQEMNVTIDFSYRTTVTATEKKQMSFEYYLTKVGKKEYKPTDKFSAFDLVTVNNDF